MTDYSAIDYSGGATIPPPSSSTPFGGSLVEGNTFYVTAGTLYLKGYRWWRADSSQSGSPQNFALWQATGSGTGVLVPGTEVTSGALSVGLNTVLYPAPIPLSQGNAYTAVTGLPGAFPFTSDYWTNGAYSGGLTSGPLVMPSGTSSQPPGFSIIQSGFDTSTGDPTAVYPGTGNNNYQCWLDVIVTDTVPAGATYRIWPDLPVPAPTDLTGTDAALIAIQFSVTQPVTAKIWHYSPSGAVVLPSAAAIWNVAGQVTVAQTLSATWSGAAGSGWVSCTNLPAVTLNAATDYKVSTFLGSSGSAWFLASTNYWGTGVGSAGRANGILTAPDNAAASPGQGSFNATTFAYPATIDNENYWVDVEVTPAAPAPPATGPAYTACMSSM